MRCLILAAHWLAACALRSASATITSFTAYSILCCLGRGEHCRAVSGTPWRLCRSVQGDIFDGTAECNGTARVSPKS